MNERNPTSVARPTFIPRPAQARILEYRGGHMGISAVPGSGKTFTLSLLAAQLVEQLAADDRGTEREVLVVTFTNSAVENFRSRIGAFLRRERGLLANVGYRVRTLHSLASEIVRERPGLVGLPEDFDIADERITADIKRDSVNGYLRSRPDALSPLIKPEFLARYQSIEHKVRDDALEVAGAVIRQAKERNLDVATLSALRRKQSGTWPLLDLGLHVYTDYQRSLQVRGAIDFDDLILLAIRALDADAGYLARLQERWPYVLEDEAQDSSRLQEELLRRLTQAHGNWVRVGDPNQAINTTFTGANTRYLRQFVAENPEQARELPNSGRSALPIIQVANRLITWSRNNRLFAQPDATNDAARPLGAASSTLHLDTRSALAPPLIEPAPPDDPQPTPPPGHPAFYFHDVPLTPEQEVATVIKSVARWLPAHPDETVAILMLENEKAGRVVEALKQAEIPFQDELLRLNDSSRATAQALATALAYIADPTGSRMLSEVWRDVWWPYVGMVQLARLLNAEPAPPQAAAARSVPPFIEQITDELRRGREPERFVFPAAQQDVPDRWTELEEAHALVKAFRADLQRWARASVLPIDELVLTIGNDLFAEPAKLALTHHLALYLARLGRQDEHMRLAQFAQELASVAQNRRRLIGFAESDGGYEAKPGRVTVATMHGAKGLEWDRVYLMAVNSYNFPSGEADQRYRSERHYIRDSLNLVAEASAQLEQLAGGTLDDYVPGPATEHARRELAAERLRLLYVGITRARKELIVTYNTGKQPEKEPLSPALAMLALKDLSVQTAG